MKSYHTHLKILTKRGTLPKHLKDEIPKSNLSRWRHEHDNKYFGVELTNIETLELFLQHRHALQTMKAYLRMAIVLSAVFRKMEHFNSFLAKNMYAVISSVRKAKPLVDFNLILRLLGISSATFYNWEKRISFPCKSSPIKLCRRIFPTQLLLGEVENMKQLLANPELKHWPIRSLTGYALREGLVFAAVNTWYKYVRIMGLSRKRIRKSRHPIGLRATRPHQIWHADIMVYKTMDGIKNYIYLIIDNYSRAILNWLISKKVSGELRMQTLRDAWNRFISNSSTDVISSRLPTVLIVDGGSENNNQTVEDFLNEHNIGIKKLIAGVDINCSNSMIEAGNKIIKYDYLFRKKYESTAHLLKGFPDDVNDYNYKRPHGSIGFLTPMEALSGIQPDYEGLQQAMGNARQNRIYENMKASCGVCE